MGISASAGNSMPSSESTNASASQDSAPLTQPSPDGKPEDIAQPSTLQRRQFCQEQSDIDSDCLIVAPEIGFIDLVAGDEDIRITEEPVGVDIDKEQEIEPKDISKAVTEGRAEGTAKSSVLQTEEEKGTLKRISAESQKNFVLDTKKARRGDDEGSSQYNGGGHVSMQIRFEGQSHTSTIKTQENEKICYAVTRREEEKPQKWNPCKLIESVMNDNKMMHRVQFLGKAAATATVSGKDFARTTTNPKLKIGTRVIAKCVPKNVKASHLFLPGVVGEEVSEDNKHRYLVFFDYGQVQYASPGEVYEVSEASANVWEDVHENLREFIHDYLTTAQALLPLQMDQRVETERNGKWDTAIVHQIDCSLVEIYFPDEKVHEWLFRGSERLCGLNFEQMQHETPQEEQVTMENVQFEKEEPIERAVPFVVEEKHQQEDAKLVPQTENPNPQGIIMNDKQIFLMDPLNLTKIVKIQPAHLCSPTCVSQEKANLDGFSLLSKPLRVGWERNKRNKAIIYKTPCSIIINDFYKLRDFLNQTESSLNVGNFNFDPKIDPTALLEIKDTAKCPLYISDMSEGKELLKIEVINAFDDTRPPELIYSTSRIPMPGVNINTDPQFMSCCDCTDDCLDKTKCACHQMTIQGYKDASRGEHLEDEGISYVWKRLLTKVETGIYECNSHCKCSSRCLNKVVQQPMQIKVQLYRTKNRGWGVKTCQDIPQGTFICIYAGHIYPSSVAEELGKAKENRDEYFADLDLIEEASRYKEGYESDVSSLHKKQTNDESDDIRHSELRELYGDKNNESVFVVDAQQSGNVARYFNHSCEPNMFVQNVLVDTHDLRFPWIAAFASENIKADSELTWDYDYKVESVPSKVLYCLCGSKKCRGRIL